MPKQKLSPLPAAAFQILMSLADDDLHGYEIMRRVEEQTSAGRDLDPGRSTAPFRRCSKRRSSPKSRHAVRKRPTMNGAVITASPQRDGRPGAKRPKDSPTSCASRARRRFSGGNMFDRVVAFLLRLYPEEFRRVYGRDALQLIWDRAGHERGVRLRTRLLMDLTRDLVVTSLTWRRPQAQSLARIDGTPRFDFSSRTARVRRLSRPGR